MDKKGRPQEIERPKTVTFKLSAEDYDALKDFAKSTGAEVSLILRSFVRQLLAANSERIEVFREQKKRPVAEFCYSDARADADLPEE